MVFELSKGYGYKSQGYESRKTTLSITIINYDIYAVYIYVYIYISISYIGQLRPKKVNRFTKTLSKCNS